MTGVATKSKPPVRFTLAAAALLSLGTLSGCGVSTANPAGPAVASGPPPPASKPIELPNADGSLKFLAFGDFGTGEPAQYELGKQMATLHQRFGYELVILLGDNVYGSESPQDFEAKFVRPYKPLLEGGVKFKASLGNHDSRQQRVYEHFGMEDKLFYSFKAPKQAVRFYALYSDYMDAEQLKWLENELKSTTDEWKIAFFHHPLYSSARGHGSTLSLRTSVEPLFVRYNVSVVFAGHDHVYERTKPQNGIVHFVVGSGGKLRLGDLNPRSALTAKGFDRDLAFLAGEIDGDNMVFQAISRSGQVVDSGIVIRRKAVKPLTDGLPPAPVSAWRSPSPPRTLLAAAAPRAGR